jgi:citrate synthase
MSNLNEKLLEIAMKNNTIEPQFYKEYGIKRGLRNDNGTGVKAILTEISKVVGYDIINGEKINTEGSLVYRGTDVKSLISGFEKDGLLGGSFEQAMYLLMFGELPSSELLDDFSNKLKKQRKLPRGFVQQYIMPVPKEDMNIMNELMTITTELYRTDKNPDDISIDNVINQSMSIIAKLPTIVAYSYAAKKYYKDNTELSIIQPNDELSHAENFLNMIRNDGKFSKVEAEILDMMLVLHADHGGGNNSTFTTHCVSSSDTDTYSTITAALASLKGPKHGGANAKVMSQMDEIKENVFEWDNKIELKNYLTKIMEKKAGDGSGLIYGIGHAVYTKSDPRAELIKKKAFELANEKGRINEFNLYKNIAEVAKEAFSEFRGKDIDINPNVDFYSGFVYDCLDFPREIYTPLFAMSRVVGWSAHRLEELISGGKIIRPASVYVGKNDVDYVPLKMRH